jgi:DNA-binding NarL/FixJ family response regulator
MGAKAIVINSSSPRICREIQRFILQAQSRDTIYTAYTNADFRVAVKTHRPWLVFLETNSWYEATPYMIAQYADMSPWMSIAAFSYERLTPSKVAGLINLGAESYIDLRQDDEQEIEKAFAMVTHDKYYLPGWIEQAVHKYSLAMPEYFILNRSEIPVLRLTALGNSITEITEKLGITNGTVRNHISNVHRKFNIHSQAEMIGLALKVGIVDPAEMVFEEINYLKLEQEVRNVHSDKACYCADYRQESAS